MIAIRHRAISSLRHLSDNTTLPEIVVLKKLLSKRKYQHQFRKNYHQLISDKNKSDRCCCSCKSLLVVNSHLTNKTHKMKDLMTKPVHIIGDSNDNDQNDR